MGVADSYNEHSLPDVHRIEPTNDPSVLPESGKSPDNEEDNPENGGPEAANDKMFHLFAARMKRAMSGEKQEGETLALLQRENDKLRAQILQSSLGRNGGDQSGFDMYAYWLRQQMRLQRMKILHSRIRGHRSQIRHMLATNGLPTVDFVEKTCDRSV